MHALQKILEASGHECRSYSGRGMYGKSCLALEVDHEESLGDVFADVLQGCADLVEDGNENTQEARFPVDQISDAIRNMSSDNMGLGMVYYFESIPYEDPDTEECDECGAAIPTTEGSEINTSHEKSCSPHPDNDSFQCIDPNCEGAGTYHDHPKE